MSITASLVRYRRMAEILSADRRQPHLARCAAIAELDAGRALRAVWKIRRKSHGLISGMVLGARDETPDEIEEQFQQTGTLHLFAVSGLNVAIVAQLLWIIAERRAHSKTMGDRA